MRSQVSLEFLNWFLALLEKYLAGLEPNELQAQESTTLAPRIYGQFGQNGLTGRQSNLTPRPGQLHQTVLIGDRRVAIGDSKKQYTRPLSLPQNSPVVLGAYLVQPFMSLSVIQREQNGVPEFAGTFPPSGLAMGYDPSDPNNNTPSLNRLVELYPDRFDYQDFEQYYPADGSVQEVWQSPLFYPDKAKTNSDSSIVFRTLPKRRPYACGFDAQGLYIAAWGEQPFFEDPGFIEPTQIPPLSFSLTIGEQVVESFEYDEDFNQVNAQELWRRPEVTLGSLNVETEPIFQPETHYAYKWRHIVSSYLYESDGQGGHTPMSVELIRPGIGLSGNSTIEFEKLELDLNEGQNWVTEDISAGITVGFISRRADRELSYALVAYPGAVSYINYGYYDYGSDELPPDDPDYEEPFPYISGDERRAVEQMEFVRYRSGFTSQQLVDTSQAFFIDLPQRDDPNPPIVDFNFGGPFPIQAMTFPDIFRPSFGNDTDYRFRSSLLFRMTPQEKAEYIPFYDGWPELPTPESRAEVARLNPYIYGLADGEYIELFDGFGQPVPPFEGYGRLANPTGPLGVESTFGGLSWETLEYVVDMFYAELTDPDTGNLVERLLTVAILKENGGVNVKLAVDQVYTGSWPLAAFFPQTDGPLKFLDETVWDGALRPHYHFAHPGWPFRDVAYLQPFRARVRDAKRDKFLKQPPDCPLTLFFDEYGGHYEPVTPEVNRQFRPKGDSGQIVGLTSLGPEQSIDEETLAALTAPFTAGEKPKPLVTLKNFEVEVDLSAVELPIRYRLKLHLYVSGTKALFAATSYNPFPKQLSSKLWRLTAEATGAWADKHLAFDPAPTFSVSLAEPLKVARMVLEVRGLKDDTEPVYANIQI